ncbi:hypothetical protein Tco_0204876 [Tanacetum coccineum]
MSSPSAHIVLETITPTDRARNSLVITPLHDEPYMLVRQDYTPIAIDIESKPYEDPIKTKETQPLPHKAAPISPDNMKRISHKKTKNKVKNDKTEHGIEKCEKTKPNRSQKKVNQVKKTKSKSKSTTRS